MSLCTESAPVIQSNAVESSGYSPDAEVVTRLLLMGTSDSLSDTRSAAEGILAGVADPCTDATFAGALTALAFAAWDGGRVTDAMGLAQAAIRRGARGPELSWHAPHLALAAMKTAIGEYDDAAALIQQRRHCASGTDATWGAVYAAFLARVRLAEGCVNEAARLAAAVLAATESTPNGCCQSLSRSVLAEVELARGRPDEAGRLIEGRDAGNPECAPWLCWATNTWTAGRIAAVQRGPVYAMAVVRPLFDDRSRLRRLLLERPSSAGWLVRIALEAGERASAQGIVAAASHLFAENAGLASVHATAMHASGLLESDGAALENAAELHVHPWARASALEDAAIVLADSGHRDRALELLQRALDQLWAIGAPVDATRVSSRLNDLTSRRRQRGYTNWTVAGWSGLTDTERQIATVVAEGLSNRAVAARVFLSPHTVDFHLRQIFRKLDVKSRVQLTRIIADRQNHAIP
jgi:DNA-binding CsgD family transcriptional regulator